tara:strand:+ start:42 stop:650 length:609 start_codon:yes stop_codon:yes gene_type:complete
MKDHTLIYARFMNNERTTIQAQWSDNNDPETIRETYIMADESDVEYERLLNLIDLEQIHENTVKFYKKANRDIIKYMEKVYKESNKSIEVITKSTITADKNVIDVTTENMSTDSMTLILNLLVKILFEDFDSKKYTESLFNLKLSLFELDFVKKSNNRILKSQIRKSKTPLELMNSVIGIYNEIHNGSSNAKSNKKVSKQSS